jgi:hypothetical protein
MQHFMAGFGATFYGIKGLCHKRVFTHFCTEPFYGKVYFLPVAPNHSNVASDLHL